MTTKYKPTAATKGKRVKDTSGAFVTTTHMQIVDAIFDGKVLLPNTPLSLKPNTRVRITIETVKKKRAATKTKSFLDVARSARLKGPRDFSENPDDYLYTGENPSMKDSVFLDTAYAIALSVETDEFHEKALELANEIEGKKNTLVTTSAVLLEIGNALSKSNFRKAALAILDSLETDKTITIIPLTEEIYDNALKLYRSRMDKEWRLIDCVSFVAMTQFGITESLTTDRHFEQAGFTALMR